MSDLRKAAEMALEALEANLGQWRAKTPAIEALRQALAMENFSEVNQEIEEALKQPKREWVGLTDEDKNELVDAFYGTDIQRLEAIEAKLKEKNT